MPARSRLRRGFTLIEVMTAVVILIILAALAVTFMVYGMGKARMNNAVFDVTAMINSAQLRAISRGSPHYIFIHQTPDNRVRILLMERPDAPPVIPNWNTLDLTQEPDVVLAFTRILPDNSVETRNAPIHDQLVLGAGSGMDSGGLAFLDLDSTRITKPLPAPFSAIAMSTPTVTPSELNKPTQNLAAGCNFCVSPSGRPYGVLRFNADGTMQVMTGDAVSGAVIAFAPNTDDEKGFTPKLLSVSAPAGAAVVF
ncbi:pilus assembly FimT family protein [Hyalangium gracile]|uniref:pilus assembly FimT family protein n=1 Tax=Hyalangium gracile TaxID=394092 RepID=UPI001CCD94C3|nr:prepilin-type N-terminal cleavage/methylation domain-containing protein [Hyalangium gracile]